MGKTVSEWRYKSKHGPSVTSMANMEYFAERKSSMSSDGLSTPWRLFGMVVYGAHQ